MAHNTIQRARALVSAGEREAAKELLLREGFIEADEPQVQRAYGDLIPPGERLAEKLRGVLANLSAPEPKVRAAAAEALAREVFKEFSTHLKEWLADPRTTDLLLAALADPDPKVAEKVAGVLSVIVSRYFPDRRVFEPMRALLQSRRMQTRLYAVFALQHLAHGDQWRVLVPTFADPAKGVRHAACRAVVFDLVPGELSKPTREDLARALRDLRSDPDAATRAMAEKALRKLIG